MWTTKNIYALAQIKCRLESNNCPPVTCIYDLEWNFGREHWYDADIGPVIRFRYMVYMSATAIERSGITTPLQSKFVFQSRAWFQDGLGFSPSQYYKPNLGCELSRLHIGSAAFAALLANPSVAE